MMPDRVNILGVGVSATTLNGAVSTILEAHAQRKHLAISTCTAHTLVQSRRDSALQSKLNRADLATPDGMPLVWLARRAGYSAVERVYGPDLMLALCAAGVPLGLRHAFYGGAPGVPEQLAQRLSERFPGLAVAATISPPYRPLTAGEDAAMVDQLNAANPDIVWVGLGSPKQDHWIIEHREQVNATALIAVGAAFDFHSGRLRQAPRWIQRSGFEWAFRLVQEPRRLWRRYLVDNAIFIGHVALQRLAPARYRIRMDG